ncbi:MAG: glycogen/starch synthase [Patescibacteria group bacterium]|jgi:starch synthase
MKVLFAVWELSPFFQVGGLGDVAKSLPKNLHRQGIDVRVILPFYKALKLHRLQKKEVKKFTVIYDGKKQKVTIFQIHFLDENIPVYILKNEKLLDIPSKDTFSFYNLCVYEILKNNYLSWVPDVIHCHDHHTGLIPLLIKHNSLKFKTLLTIHNLNHQGKYSLDVIKRTGLDHSKCRVIQWETKKKQVNFLLEGIIHADLVNAVSPSYAKEIFTEEYGSGLDEIIRNEGQKISGILNGIDYDSRDPIKDKNINFHYGVNQSPIEGKRLNKKFLQEKLGFTVSDQIPLIGFIGRFESKQKGLDIMHKMIRRVNLQKFQFVILGQGEVEWEDQFLWLASFYKKNVAYISVFDKRIASQIYAASDFILVPSKFEPCGLIQMIAMRYGTLPIARATGGLKDSIIDGVDGFLFKKYSSFDLEAVMKKAVGIWKNDKNKINNMIVNAMKKDFTWDKSAREYIKLYNKLCNPSEIS